MQSSSTLRTKSTFVPWLVALIVGATVHTGWLIHELREAPTATSCRCANIDLADDPDYDLWIHQTSRAVYTIDRRALERVVLAEGLGNLDRLLAYVRVLPLAEPVELRNIQAGTPLHLLGLRTGDRLVAISTNTGESIERVEVSIERRGRALELTYELL
jgi:hypothetical protein